MGKTYENKSLVTNYNFNNVYQVGEAQCEIRAKLHGKRKELIEEKFTAMLSAEEYAKLFNTSITIGEITLTFGEFLESIASVKAQQTVADFDASKDSQKVWDAIFNV